MLKNDVVSPHLSIVVRKIMTMLWYKKIGLITYKKEKKKKYGKDWTMKDQKKKKKKDDVKNSNDQ